jgi:hypothetical protein
VHVAAEKLPPAIVFIVGHVQYGTRPFHDVTARDGTRIIWRVERPFFLAKGVPVFTHAC